MKGNKTDSEGLVQSGSDNAGTSRLWKEGLFHTISLHGQDQAPQSAVEGKLLWLLTNPNHEQEKGKISRGRIKELGVGKGYV